MAFIAMHDDVDSASGAAFSNADYSANSFLGKVDWKVGHYEKSKRFGYFADFFIVITNVIELVSEVFLDDRFHVFIEV